MNHLFGDRVLNGQFLQLMGIVLPVLRRIGQRSGEPLGDLRFQPSDGLFVSLGGRELRSGCWLRTGYLLHLLCHQLHVGIRVLEKGVVGPGVRHERGQLSCVTRFVEFLDHFTEPGDVDIPERFDQLQVQIVLDYSVA